NSVDLFFGTTNNRMIPSSNSILPSLTSLWKGALGPAFARPPALVSTYTTTLEGVYSCPTSQCGGSSKTISSCSLTVEVSLAALTKSDCALIGYMKRRGYDSIEAGSNGSSSWISASCVSGAFNECVILTCLALRAI